MFKSKSLFACLFIAFLLPGCATMMNGEVVNVPVTTVPEGAKITVNGASYTSPATVMLPRGKGHYKLFIEKEGYEPVEMMLSQSTSDWVWGNIIFGGIIGLVVDFETGQAYDISPRRVTRYLKRSVAKKATKKNSNLMVIDINQLSPEMRRELLRAAKKK